MIYYTVYKITNSFNGKIYVGYHSTNNLNDNYMGSGLRIKRLINKYGVKSFVKEILHIFDNEKDMIAKEIEIVTEDFVRREDTYNLVVGGGSFDSRSGKFANKILLNRLKNDTKFSKEWSITCKKNMLEHTRSEEHSKNISISLKGKKKSEDFKKAVSLTLSKKIWIKNPVTKENIRLSPSEAEQFFQNGWVRGRSTKIQI